jgi:hypothetical protein
MRPDQSVLSEAERIGNDKTPWRPGGEFTGCPGPDLETRNRYQPTRASSPCSLGPSVPGALTPDPDP